MTTSILSILASVLGVLVTLFFGGKIATYLQAYYTARQKSEVEEARKATLEADQKANAESDALKQIDGR